MFPFYPGYMAFMKESGNLYKMNTSIVKCIKYFKFETCMKE